MAGGTHIGELGSVPRRTKPKFPVPHRRSLLLFVFAMDLGSGRDPDSPLIVGVVRRDECKVVGERIEERVF